MDRDKVDLLVEQWKKEIPKLNVKPMAILGRTRTICKITERRSCINFSKFNINIGEFDVLSALRRSGGEFKLKPTELYNFLMITSGAMTNRIDTLEKKGLVTRVNDPEDRRTVYVKLTEEGLKLINESIFHYVNMQEKILEVLTEEEQDTLNVILRKLALSMEEK